ncbi:unnamed protein product [Dovyalis caffra]|uniref:Uncharacterized protein n=1 Tax=Dovyalis caffra TaxID=77055 RepID=A0AAV1QRH2_9ROSI|nr:unnamed protein product [Dovyalis caffra]
MASTRVDFTLTAKTTYFVDPKNSFEPMFVVKLLFQRKCQTSVRITGGPQDLPVDESPIAQNSILFEIPFQVVAQPESSLAYISHIIHGLNIRSASLSNNLASRIASFADNLLSKGCFGFYVLACLGVVHEEIVNEVVSDSEEDDSIADESTGTQCASKINLEDWIKM